MSLPVLPAGPRLLQAQGIAARPALCMPPTPSHQTPKRHVAKASIKRQHHLVCM